MDLSVPINASLAGFRIQTLHDKKEKKKRWEVITHIKATMSLFYWLTLRDCTRLKPRLLFDLSSLID